MPKQSTKIYHMIGAEKAFGNPELIAAIREEQTKICTSCGGDGVCAKCDGSGEITEKKNARNRS